MGKDKKANITVVYLLPPCPHLWMNFLDEFFAGHKLKLLFHKVHAHLIHNSCLAHSQVTKKTKKVQKYLVNDSCLAQSRHLQMTKYSASDYSRVGNGDNA